MNEAIDKLRAMLDEFEHECFMIRVEASETRAKDDVVREAYERQREETAQAIAATLGRPTWRNSYDRERHESWYNSLFHGEPTSFKELIEDIIWTTETVDIGPNGNECQGVDEGEFNTECLIESWARKAATLGSGTCKVSRPNCSDFDYCCSKCGEQWSQVGNPRCCPNCRAEVVVE